MQNDTNTNLVDCPGIIFVEPFYGGSHKTLIDNLTPHLTDYELVTLPAKKWHWKARCGALMLYDQIPHVGTKRVLFSSSVLSLAELLGLRPDLVPLRKVVYFHENQLVYPVKDVKERDIQYAYNQITTCLAADVVLFNSHFNKDSFLESIKKILKIVPQRMSNELKSKIESKSKVLYFPVTFPATVVENRSSDLLHIVWPHRWEFDKGPEEFFTVLFKLKDNGVPFKLSVLGESFSECPSIFSKAKSVLKDEIINFGFLDSKDDYLRVLSSGHVVVSTAKHEFFGVSMLEATYCGCYPIAPKSLVYPEIYPSECLYSNFEDLYSILERFCQRPVAASDARNKLGLNFDKYSTNRVVSEFVEVIKGLLTQ